jgi:hypothetical protein
MYNLTLNGVPLTRLRGDTVDISDISVLLRFHFWQHVYFKLAEPSFPLNLKKDLDMLLESLRIVAMHSLTKPPLLNLRSSSIVPDCILLLQMMIVSVPTCLEGRVSTIVIS